MDRAVIISPVARWPRAAAAALAVAWRSTLLRLTLWSRFFRHRFERRLEDAVELDGPIGSLAGILEVTDRGVYRHSLRVARHAAAIARGLGLSRDRVARIHAAAVLHDIGKMRTPQAILAKADPLTEQEYSILKKHAETGAEMVTTLGDPELAEIVRHHHERIDGAGYPAGLAGEGIPIGARIVAVADVFDALTSERPYQAAMAPGEALALLEAEAGAQLDPRVVELFRRYYSGRRPAVASRPFAAGHAGRLKFAAPLVAVPMAAAAVFVLAGSTAPSTAPTVASAPKVTHVKPAPSHFVRGGAVPAPGPAAHTGATKAFAAFSPGGASGSGDAVSIGQSPSSGADHGGAPQLETVEPGAAVAGATKPEPESNSEPAPATEPAPAPVPAPATEPAPSSVPAAVSVPAATVPPAVSAGTVPEPPLVEEPESALPPEPEPTLPPLPGSPATTVPPPPNQQDGPEQTEQSLGQPSPPAEAADGLVEEPSL
jgi:putative nucleotidyltransferase with HDIG domain